MINSLQTAYNALGGDLIADELPTDVFNRINIIKWMCLYGGSNCREVMTEKLSSEEFVHPDLQTPVYCGGMRNGTSSNWEYLYKKYVNGSIESLERSRVLSALGCSLNRDIVERYGINYKLYYFTSLFMYNIFVVNFVHDKFTIILMTHYNTVRQLLYLCIF